jgi:hypothetical protein
MAASGGLSAIAAGPAPRWLNNFGRAVGATALLVGLTLLYLMAVAFIRQ